LGEPILSCTLILPDEEVPLNDAYDIQEKIGKRVDLIIDGGECDNVATTVLDIGEEGVRLVRQGKGLVPDVL
jgi:tRNA A37 threonylcarbamoyladenosine synthetase subunit TsaC/SUA5/YrdC